MPEVTKSSSSYSLISKCIHWITALIILGLLCIGLYMSSLDYSADKLKLYNLHKSFGLLVLMLACVRVVWHFIKKKPAPLKTHKKWESFLSHTAHGFLYFAIFALPLNGWLMSSAGDFPITFFGIDVPYITTKNEALFQTSREIHERLAFILMLVIGLHAAGALKHHFIDRDETLKRMTSHRLGFKSAAALVIIFSPLYIFSAVLFAGEILGEEHERQVVSTAASQVETAAIVPEQEESQPFNKTAQEWRIDTENSTLKFTAIQYGQSFAGEFDFDGKIFFDEQNLEQSSAHIKIDISSIKTGSADRDAQAISEDWFYAENHPTAIFESSDFIQKDENQYIANGYLTVRGVKLPLSLPFSLQIKPLENQDVHSAVMAAHISVNRLDYGVGQGEWSAVDAIGDKVEINMGVIAHAVPLK